MLDAHVGGLDNMDIDPPSNQNANSRDPHRKLQKHHASDSGIGSTETSSEISREKAGMYPKCM
jgi:hypothetical protein